MKGQWKVGVIVAGTALGLIAVLCAPGNVLGVVKAQETDMGLEAELKAAVQGNNAFALELYAKLKGDENVERQGGNIFFSPYSISTALAMTYAGARGETEKQMAETLHFSLGQERLHSALGALEKRLNAGGKRRTYQLAVANALWGQKGYGFREEFLRLVKDSYGAGLNEVNFANDAEKARRVINKWVADKTREKIKDLIKPGVLDSLTRLVLTNAIYFKGDWARKFKEENTGDAPFYVTKKQTQEVPMMYQKGRFNYVEEDGVLILELPYKGEDLSMVVLLPKVDGLAELEESLTAKQLEEWLGRLHRCEVAVYLPKFKMTSEFSLAKILAGMGMGDAFSLPPADFSGMTGEKDLFISHVLHKAFVEVNEEGTEAAAATAVPMTLGSPMPVPVFRADHPFVFIIRDNRTGGILFMGRVMNPQPEGAKEKEAKLPQDKDGNFVLYVSNQSFGVSPVDIRVFIDGKLAIDEAFDVGNQHNWKSFRYNLGKGKHRLAAESVKGAAKFERDLEVRDTNWSVLDYWDSPGHFSFHTSDKPIHFR